ncbi:MAG: TM0106 family RecB-like putative nuclease, partial [Acidimicrobiia bacterium]|nr:TM0106 family RecB-like putative nuclease [Acidimicrobiia bacterium]
FAAIGERFDTDIRTELVARHPGAVVIPSGLGARAATDAALASGATLIIGGFLSTDDRMLVGAPDLLVRMDDGYAAVEIKSHKVLTAGGSTVTLGTFDAPTQRTPVDDVGFRPHRRRDLYQVTHYWRILSSMGFATTRPLGGVIGTDDRQQIVWVDLDVGDAPILDAVIDHTTEGLEAIAFGRKHPDRPLVAPWWRGECGHCPWAGVCRPVLEAIDDPTLVRGIDRSARDALAGHGITTVAELAMLDPESELVADGANVLDARSLRAGELLRREPPDHPLSVPGAPIEVDFDIETYGGHIYLAGFLVTDATGTRYDPVHDWTGTDSGERRVVAEMFDRLDGYGASNAVVYHWTGYERDQLCLAAERHGLSIPGYRSVADWFDHHAVDLHRWTKDTFVWAGGYSLKTIAPLCGFAWRDEDPGGMQSELWFADHLEGDDAMRPRILDYNEDDVRAQLAIRTWVRARTTRDGSSIRSVLTPPGTEAPVERPV